MTETEEWRPVLGCEESYVVSNRGRVRRIRSSRGAVVGRILKPMPDPRGYRRVSLRYGGLRHTRLISQLVCEAFHGPRQTGLEVRHLDGNSGHDDAANLAWGTSAENKADMVKHGTAWWLQRTHCVHGHEFTPENTTSSSTRGRICLACKRERTRRYDAKRRGRSESVL